jgi:hypothetical protein
MLLRVIHAEYIKGHQLLIQFNNGKSVYVDLAQEFDGPIFEPLSDVNFFQKFSIVGNTIEWPNGADFAPEFLYEIGTLASEHARRKVAEDSPTYGHR